MKCLLRNVLSLKCPVYEMSGLWNVLSMKHPVYEMSYLWNVLSMKCFNKMSYLWNVLDEMSFYEISQHLILSDFFFIEWNKFCKGSGG